MAKLTMNDVNKRLEEIRTPQQNGGGNVAQRLQAAARRRLGRRRV